MNRKQLRRERRIKNKQGRIRHREHLARNRSHWCNAFGDPLAVMDDPTEFHIKALMLRWLVPRRVYDEIQQGLEEAIQLKIDQTIKRALIGTFEEEIQTVPDLVTDMWSYLFRLSTSGNILAPPNNPVRIDAE